MSEKVRLKVCLKEKANQPFLKGNISDYPNFEKLKNSIFETVKKKSTKITGKDKFILEIEGFQLAELNSVWDSITYKYLYDRIESNPPDSIKLLLTKVNKLPTFQVPEYVNILKNSLQSKWESSKKRIENELTEKYLDNEKRNFILEKKGKEKNITEDLFQHLHIYIICNNCLKTNFSGSRFICAECDNYNLCEYCQEKIKNAHNPEHIFIRLDNPIFIDIHKYNCLLSPNKLLLKKAHEPFTIQIKVKNNGEEDIQGSFISPIRFGNNYLGCLKKTIPDECKNGEECILDILIKFEDDDEKQFNDEYEGYFRLMTEEGIPFGDILYIQLDIEKN